MGSAGAFDKSVRSTSAEMSCFTGAPPHYFLSSLGPLQKKKEASPASSFLMLNATSPVIYL
jgi:hypothetical protein